MLGQPHELRRDLSHRGRPCELRRLGLGEDWGWKADELSQGTEVTRAGPHRKAEKLRISHHHLKRWPSLVAAFLLIILLDVRHQASHQVVSGIVQKVSDGDTLTVLTANGTKLKVRLHGIDAPEPPHGKLPGQPFGEASQKALEQKLLRQRNLGRRPLPPLGLSRPFGFKQRQRSHDPGRLGVGIPEVSQRI